MTFITGPLWSGKRDFACRLLGCTREELSARAVWDVQELAAAATTAADAAERCVALHRTWHSTSSNSSNNNNNTDVDCRGAGGVVGSGGSA